MALAPASSLSPLRRRVAIAVVAVGGALLLGQVVALSMDDDVAEVAAARTPRSTAAARQDTARAAAPAPLGVQLARLDVRHDATGASSPAASVPPLIASVSWQAPAPVLVAPAPPPRPVAPPFPYAYLGGLSDDGERTAFFLKGERVLALRVGEVVDGQYRVDEMNDKQMTLTYLPLEETLVVALGGGR